MKRPTKHDRHDDSGRTIVYVVGWPKSGCTWLARLLGDALNCPVGGSVPRKDYKEIASEGWDRHEPFIVRKTHAVLVDKEGGPVMIAPNRLAWRNLTDERIVYILRDPRDIVISVAWYHGITVTEALAWLCDGWKMPIEGGWCDYIERWLNIEFACVYTRFEALLESGPVEVGRILGESRLPVDMERITLAVERQSFTSRRRHVQEQDEKCLRGERYEKYLRGTEYHLRFMRKGVAGDWRNRLSRKHGQRAQTHFGSLMRRLGYTDDDNWWRELPRR